MRVEIAFVWEGTALRGASSGVAERNEFFPQQAAVGPARDRGQDDGLAVVARGTSHLWFWEHGAEPAPPSQGL